jgi:Uma2 family endonuclease
MPVSEQTYLQVVLEDPEGKWELHCGQLRSKPPMTWEHVRIASVLGFRLQQQLPLDRYIVAEQSGRARRSETQYYVPDVLVVPTDMAGRLFTQPGMVASFPEPLPLVVEVWSPSTGDYDVTEKLPEYRRRGDLEIWLLHPYERTLTAWRRQPDGSYAETVYRGGTVQPVALPNVSINLDGLFNL